jgi:hypothetical protein
LRAKTPLFLLTVMVLLTAVVMVAGCGGSGAALNVKGKATLTAALSDFEMSAGAVQNALTGGADGTVAADVKAADSDMAAKWQKVAAAAKAMGWADADAGNEAWKAVEKAANSLPTNATVAQAQAAVQRPLDTLMEVESELWTLVQTSK